MERNKKQVSTSSYTAQMRLNRSELKQQEVLLESSTARPVSMTKLEQQADAGDGAAACILADHYRTGDVVAQDWEIAFHWYSRGAALDDRDAQNNLGTMFLEGLGCKPNKAQAIHWYRKSAEQGNADAQWNLGKRYLHGDGIDQNYTEAYEWFKKAALQGHTAALCEMGTMHRFGHGVQRNLLAAADFHLNAAEAGDEVACGNLSDYRAELEKMAISGSQMASLFLCRIYNRGFGTDKSQSLTWSWISVAKKHCTRDTDAEIAKEVSEAYQFYKMCISTENRKLGDQTLANMREAKTGNTRRHKGKQTL